MTDTRSSKKTGVLFYFFSAGFQLLFLLSLPLTAIAALQGSLAWKIPAFLLAASLVNGAIGFLLEYYRMKKTERVTA